MPCQKVSRVPAPVAEFTRFLCNCCCRAGAGYKDLAYSGECKCSICDKVSRHHVSKHAHAIEVYVLYGNARLANNTRMHSTLSEFVASLTLSTLVMQTFALSADAMKHHFKKSKHHLAKLRELAGSDSSSSEASDGDVASAKTPSAVKGGATPSNASAAVSLPSSPQQRPLKASDKNTARDADGDVAMSQTPLRAAQSAASVPAASNKPANNKAASQKQLHLLGSQQTEPEDSGSESETAADAPSNAAAPSNGSAASSVAQAVPETSTLIKDPAYVLKNWAKYVYLSAGKTHAR
jgi:hypothetical protein